MSRILCFGDSNTYGYNPKGGRYGESERWTARLAARLGATVIEEGLGGRTCVLDDPTEGGYKSGAAYLPPCLMSHAPLDAVVLMLGTNDAKARFGLTPVTIGEGLAQLVRLIRLYGADAAGQSPAVLIVAPPPRHAGSARHAPRRTVWRARHRGHARHRRRIRPSGTADALRLLRRSTRCRDLPARRRPPLPGRSRRPRRRPRLRTAPHPANALKRRGGRRRAAFRDARQYLSEVISCQSAKTAGRGNELAVNGIYSAASNPGAQAPLARAAKNATGFFHRCVFAFRGSPALWRRCKAPPPGKCQRRRRSS